MVLGTEYPLREIIGREKKRNSNSEIQIRTKLR